MKLERICKEEKEREKRTQNSQEQAGPSETQRTQPHTTSLEPLSSLRIAMGKMIILKGQRAGPGCTLRAVRFAR
ncbi:hypothetical protein CRENBAI_014987 [Crenichthys baileyi]|uniref:Uncharacterized protein n=1 Tax=Crenichthys baileyi TaxID=28760 RepID=A0AAV9RDP4_9TELE